jgi:ABC-type multidrug transport system permease subunit
MEKIGIIKKEALKFYGYLKKDFLLMIKRKKYLYLSLLIPLVLAFLFLLIISPNAYNLKIGVCDFDKTDYSEQAYINLNSFTPILLEQENCVEHLKEKIKNKELPIGMKIDKGFASKLNKLEQSSITIYYDNTDVAFSNLVSWKVDLSLNYFKRNLIETLHDKLKERIILIRQSADISARFNLKPEIENEIDKIAENLKIIESLKTEFLIRPVTIEHDPIYIDQDQQSSGITFVFPIIALFIILMLTSTSLIYDMKTNFITRVKASTTLITYLLAKIVFFFFITVIQFVIIFLLFLAYDGSYIFNIFHIFNLILFIGVINTLIGLLIGIVSESEGIAILLSLLLAFPLMLLSGIFYPTQIMPTVFQYIEKILPLYYQINASKITLLFGQSIGLTWILPALILFGIVYFFLSRKN